MIPDGASPCPLTSRRYRSVLQHHENMTLRRAPAHVSTRILGRDPAQRGFWLASLSQCTIAARDFGPTHSSCGRGDRVVTFPRIIRHCSTKFSVVEDLEKSIVGIAGGAHASCTVSEALRVSHRESPLWCTKREEDEMSNLLMRGTVSALVLPRVLETQLSEVRADRWVVVVLIAIALVAAVGLGAAWWIVCQNKGMYPAFDMPNFSTGGTWKAYCRS